MKSETELKRSRDIRSITLFLRQMNTSIVDMHIERMPHQLSTDIVKVALGVEGVVASSEFKLYDSDVDIVALSAVNRRTLKGLHPIFWNHMRMRIAASGHGWNAA